MKDSGFTLIELVIVIVILGILAAVAVPKFVDLSGDATAASVKNISGSLKTAIDFAILKDQIAGGSGEPLDYLGNTITFTSGIPTPSADQMRFLLDMDFPSTTFTANWATVPCSNSEYCIVGNRPFSDTSMPVIPSFTSGTGVFLWPEGYILSDCFTYYINLADGTEPIVSYDTSGC